MRRLSPRFWSRGSPAPAGATQGSDISRATSLYLLLVGVSAVAASLPAFTHLNANGRDWLILAVLGTSAAISSLLIVPTGKSHGFHLALVFIAAAIVLLPPALVALVPVIQHIPDWVRRRYAWYIRAFNTSNYAFDALAGWLAGHLVLQTPVSSPNLRFALAGLAASATFVLANHLLLAFALKIARRVTFRESLLFSGHSLWIDISLSALGIGLGDFWRHNPYLMPIIVAPLILIHRSFALLSLLRSSEERFRAIFESTALGIRLTGLDGRLLQTNASYDELLGYSADELKGRTVTEHLHPDEREEDAALFSELLAGERKSYEGERRLLRKDGSELWVHLTSSIVHDAEGKATFVIGMVQDVRERKHLEEQLRHAQKMEAIGQLAGGIAHDFNNVLTVIESYSTFALQRLQDGDERTRSDVEQIQKAGQKASALTRQLLAFGRRQVLQPEVLDLNALVADTESMLRPLMRDGVEVVQRLNHPIGLVKTDPDEIVQVLINLAVNARDAMPNGGTITLETADVELEHPEIQGGAEAPAGSYVQLTVRDTGTGIDPEILPRVFEPFFTTKEKGKGTGLGLSTVYGIVAQSGGYLFITTELGKGTSFRLLFPRVDAESPVSKEAVQLNGHGGTGAGETVLLVDDEDRVRDAVRRMLSGAGYKVLEAFDGEEALRVAERFRGTIELLVTDVVMRRMSGTELVERIAPIRPEMKVLFMSGYPAENDLEEALSADGLEYLQKPFTADALCAKARALLDGPVAEAEPVAAEA
jgi:PAS domain S-box-containing protein